VVSNTIEIFPPLLPPFKAECQPENETAAADKTSDFLSLQTHVKYYQRDDRFISMAAEKVGHVASVRHLYFGVYRNHEDLIDNITVLNSRT